MDSESHSAAELADRIRTPSLRRATHVPSSPPCARAAGGGNGQSRSGYNINKHLAIRFQANNLTNQVSRYYWNNDPQQLARYDKYGPSYLMDVTFKY